MLFLTFYFQTHFITIFSVFKTSFCSVLQDIVMARYMKEQRSKEKKELDSQWMILEDLKWMLDEVSRELC